MADQRQRERKPPPQQPKRPKSAEDKGKADHPLEEDPAVERGERIATGKTIPRGGKSTGYSRAPPSESRSSRESYREVIKNPSV